MRLNNSFIFYDLEATSKTTPEGRKENNDLIQYGGVLVDRNLQIVSSYSTYVKNREPISQEIQDLCKIDPKWCEEAPTFDVASQNIETWAGQHVTNLKNVRQVCWGTHFDENLWRLHYRQYNRQYPWSGTCFDVKSWAVLYLALNGHRSDKIKIEHVISILGLESKLQELMPDGHWHHALYDSFAAALIAIECFKRMEGAFFMEGKRYKVVKDE